ncbi:MAG TPA: flagellar filament capping protein FliD [Aromatoleum sp.]|uniref:flagellar filament capping protein FliD n=1 Tax=Aromatoleum sp. TaxID=2307007 RepID=UPI002B46BAFE|nr:flagellar filament capping protein FliD [Aromatoleum sp.]HJV28227.1 flagellar filament capping protein FliD [Aromatoleum sp.]
MNISPLISPLNLFGLGGINPVSATQAQNNASALTSLTSSSTFVQISDLGHLLSSIVAFQDSLSALHPGSTNSGLGRNFGTDFGSLAAEAQSFVDAFNGLQSDISPFGGTDAGSGLFGILSGSSQTTQVSNALSERFASAFDNGDSALTHLADIGIQLQASPLPGLGGRASIDLAKLKSAFDSDPAGSFSLLSNAVQSFGTLASDFTGDTSSGSRLGSLLSFNLAQQSLGLLGFNGSQTGLPGASNLLALASLSDGTTSSQAQLLSAMNQFTLVSSLLG